MPTYRTNGAWGSGIGVNLTPAQVDANFYELRTDLDDVIANPPTADSIVSVSQSGFNLTFHTTLGNELGPIAIPIVYTVWRGDWAPFTLYSAADIFRVVDQGIFSVLADHTSAATFDPLATGGSPPEPYYNELIGVSTLPSATTLDELSDVTITGVAGGDLLAWDTGTSQWINQPPGTALAGILALDDLSDVITTVTNVGDVLRYLGGSPDKGWQPHALVLDDIADVSAAAPGNGYVLTYQAGSPTGWIAASPAAIPTTLDALTDVVAPSPTNGDVLQFDGADWINAAGGSTSGLADAFLPLVGSDLFEISQSSGSPPGSPPVGYESRKATLANILSAGGFTLGSTSIALGGTTTTISGLTLSGTTSLPGSSEITSAGELLLKSTTPITMGSVTTAGLQTVLTGGAPCAAWTHFSADVNTNYMFFGKSRGTPAAAAAVQALDPIWVWRAYGDDGSANGQIAIKAAEHICRVEGTVSAGVVPARLTWSTMNAAGVFGERLRLHSSGGLSLGNQTDPGATNLSVTGTVAATGKGSSLPDQIHSNSVASTAQLDKTSNVTLATITGLSVALTAGKTYKICGWLSTTSGAAGGLKVALVASGGLTATSARFQAIAFNGTTIVANTTVTALGSNIVANNAIVTDVYIEGSIVVNAAGTINVQAAQNTSDATTTSIFIGSVFEAKRIN